MSYTSEIIMNGNEITVKFASGKMTWNDAIKFAADSGPEWRLPYQFELEGIGENKYCRDRYEAVAREAFPDVDLQEPIESGIKRGPAVKYWTIHQTPDKKSGCSFRIGNRHTWKESIEGLCHVIILKLPDPYKK